MLVYSFFPKKSMDFAFIFIYFYQILLFAFSLIKSGSRLPPLTDCLKSAPKWPHAKKYTSLHFSLRMAAGGALAAVFLISYNSQAAAEVARIRKALRGSQSPRASTMIFLFFLPGSQMILSFCSLLPRHICSWLCLYHYAP